VVEALIVLVARWDGAVDEAEREEVEEMGQNGDANTRSHLTSAVV